MGPRPPLPGLCWLGAWQHHPTPFTLTPYPAPSSLPLPPSSASPPLSLPLLSARPPPPGPPVSRSPALSPEGSVWSVRGRLGTEKFSGDVPPKTHGQQVARCGQRSGLSSLALAECLPPALGWAIRGVLAPACLLGPPCPAATVLQAGHSPGHCPEADGAAHGPARRCRWPPRGPWWTCWPASGHAPSAQRTGRGPRGARWSGSRRLQAWALCARCARPRRPPPSHSTPRPPPAGPRSGGVSRLHSPGPPGTKASLCHDHFHTDKARALMLTQ